MGGYARRVMTSARTQLLEILRRKSVMYGDFTLASGKRSDFYCDARLTTLDPRGAMALGEVGWEMVVAESAKLGVVPVAIGGLTMGADPVALAIGMKAGVRRLRRPGCRCVRCSRERTLTGLGREGLEPRDVMTDRAN